MHLLLLHALHLSKFCNFQGPFKCPWLLPLPPRRGLQTVVCGWRVVLFPGVLHSICFSAFVDFPPLCNPKALEDSALSHSLWYHPLSFHSGHMGVYLINAKSCVVMYSLSNLKWKHFTEGSLVKLNPWFLYKVVQFCERSSSILEDFGGILGPVNGLDK